MTTAASLSFSLESAVRARRTGAPAGRPRLLVRDDLNEATETLVVVVVNFLFKLLNCGSFDRVHPSFTVRALRALSPALRCVVIVQSYVFCIRGLYTEPQLTFAHLLKHPFAWFVFACYVLMYTLTYVSMLSGRFGNAEERSGTPGEWRQLPFILLSRARFGFDSVAGMARAAVTTLVYTASLGAVLIATHALMAHMETTRNTACAALFAIQFTASVVSALADATVVGGHFGVHTQDVVAGVALSWRVIIALIPLLPCTIGFFVFCFPTYHSEGHPEGARLA